MWIITRSRLVTFWTEHPDSQTSLRLWYKLVQVGTWTNFVELRSTFPAADQVGNFTVFNIGGNKYRLIALIDYRVQKVFIRHVLTHAEYDKEDWKNDAWFN